jgi:hypothetical protein
MEISVQRSIAYVVRPDRNKISLKNEDEIKYWIRHFDVTHEQLLRVIEKVGNSAASVRKELQTNRRSACTGR